jgi:O-antigen/teichoic acid export membrane protein
VVVFVAGIIRQYANLRPSYIPGLPWKFLKLGIVYGLALFILSMNYRIDILILERLSSATDVGIYSIGVGVAEKLWLLPNALTTVNFARSAVSEDAISHARKTAKVLRIVLWLSIIPCIILYLLAPWLIPLIYGGSYSESGFVVQAILPGIWATLIFKILNSDLAGRGRPDAAMWVYGLALIMNVVLNLLWIPEFGAIGSAWASSISYLIGAFIFSVVYSKISHVSMSDLFIPRKLDFKLSFRNQI